MKSRIITVAIAVGIALAALTSGCGAVRDIVNSAAEQFSDSTPSEIGAINVETGKTYSTQWFNFKVHSAQYVDEYAGYAPREGNTLLDILIEETNTFEEPIPMGTFDFYITMENASHELYPMNPIDDDPTMMPEEFELDDGEKAEYHMLFEFPDDSSGIELNYTEIDEEETISAIFTLAISPPEPEAGIAAVNL
jgi:hypothetical protein